ncbi:MAG: hypothetical protein LUC23_04000 [Prevotellaceae bacterium]|nr:hypothetical protein [Prevotellaceae bacterium]
MKNSGLNVGMLCLALLLLPMLWACDNKDESFALFQFNEDGSCYYPSMKSISKSRFNKYVVGHGWYCESTNQIASDGSLVEEAYYDARSESTPHHYNFEDSSHLTVFYCTDGGTSCGFSTYEYSYEAGTNLVTPDFQLLSVSSDRITALECLEITSGRGKAYVYTSYRRMTNTELEECEETYAIDFLGENEENDESPESVETGEEGMEEGEIAGD